MSDYRAWCPTCGASKGRSCVDTRMVYMPRPIGRAHKARRDRSARLGRVIHPDGTVVDILAAERHFTLEEMRRAIGGGYLERIPCPDPAFLVFVDEDGLARGLAPNQRATEALGRPLVGPVLIVPRGSIQ